MKIAKIQYITQAQDKEKILKEVTEVVAAGIEWVQLRIKNPELDFLDIAIAVKQICAHHTLIINDRVDIAKEIDADGVHIGKEDMSPVRAREILGDDKIIGGTANTIEDCLNLELKGVDYIGLGPFKLTNTKEKLSPVLGLKGYQEIVPKEIDYGWQIMSVSKPVIAIGGLDEIDTKELVRHTGIYGVAISGAIYRSQNKKELIKTLKEIFATENESRKIV